MSKQRTDNPVTLGREMKPTMKHRPAIWEAMLGTVYAMNADRVVKGFDYDWPAALRFAGIDLDDPTQDIRNHRVSEPHHPTMRRRQRVLFIKREDKR